MQEENKNNFEEVTSSESELVLNEDGKTYSFINENGTLEITRVPLNDISVNVDEGLELRNSGFTQMNLNESILSKGLISPIYLGLGPVINGVQKYILIDGKKRLTAFKSVVLDPTDKGIPALVNTSLDKKLFKYVRVMLNSLPDYNPAEKLAVANTLNNTFKNINHSNLEKLVNLKERELSKLIDLKESAESNPKQYYSFYKRVVDGESSIVVEHKKLENAIKKAENKDEKDDIEETKIDGEANNKQTQDFVGESRVLSAELSKSVETRDMLRCQACGYGTDQPSVSVAFERHHIAGVQYGGKTVLNNLILLCSNCHAQVTGYDTGRWDPSEEEVKNFPSERITLLLGKMNEQQKKQALRSIKNHDENLYQRVLDKKLTVGQAIKEKKIDVGNAKGLRPNPYSVFKESVLELHRKYPEVKIVNPDWKQDEATPSILNLSKTNNELISDSVKATNKESSNLENTTNTAVATLERTDNESVETVKDTNNQIESLNIENKGDKKQFNSNHNKKFNDRKKHRNNKWKNKN